MNASTQYDEKLARLELRRRIEGFAVGSPLALVPVAASITALIFAYGSQAPGGLIALWVAAALAIVAARLFLARRLTPDAHDITTLRRQWTGINVVLMLGSLAWAVSLPLVAWAAADRNDVTLAVIGAALLGGLLPIHRTAPTAAAVHALSLGSGLMIALWIASGSAGGPVVALVAIYVLTLAAAAAVQDRHFRAACRAEFDRRRSTGIVRKLLSDYEDQAADWQWTAGPNGALCEVSEPFAAALGTTPEALEGQDLISLIQPGRERDRFAALLAARTPFHDDPVVIEIAGTRRLWRLSGHPRPDGRIGGVGRDVTEQQQIVDRVRTMAQVDPLTGLANRHSFNQGVREMLRDDPPGNRSIALLCLDVDDFKSVNDTQGHVFGDSLLREIGRRLRTNSRESDLVARLGGDEFAVLVEGPGGDGMLIERAHRLLAAMREPFQVEGQIVRVSASIGIARAAPGCDAAELMRRVDLALYAAKGKGRDQMALFDEALDRRARERRALELELREAVARDQMVLHYQPIIALRNGATVGYEALLRWRHPRRGLLLPDEFLPVAEESGLIVSLGDWVIHRALADISEWRGDFRIALNLSPSQIRNPLLIATIDRALSASGVAPGRLELEVTESVLLEDAAAGAAFIKRLRLLGAEIALDDFGTGYSSLSYLRRFRFDRVKIDRTFVRDIETSDEAQAIVSAITRLAQALGMRTTAEGVERPEQLDLLRKLGCDEAQGFLILEPVEAERIEQARARGEDLPEIAEEIEGYREARRAALAEVASLGD